MTLLCVVVVVWGAHVGVDDALCHAVSGRRCLRHEELLGERAAAEAAQVLPQQHVSPASTRTARRYPLRLVRMAPDDYIS